MKLRLPENKEAPLRSITGRKGEGHDPVRTLSHRFRTNYIRTS